MTRLLWALALFFAFASWHASDLYFPWLKFQSEMWAGASLLCVTLACGSKARAQLHSDSTRLNCWGVFLGGVLLFVAGHAVFNKAVFAGDAALLAVYAVGALVALQQARLSFALYGTKCFDVLCWLLLASAVLTVGEALYQWLQLEGLGFWILRLPDNARPSGNFAQANRMALHTAVGIAAIFWLHRRAFLGRFVVALAVAFLGLGVALSQSRAGILSSVLILGAAAFFCRNHRRDAFTYIGLIFLVGFVFWILPDVSMSLELGVVRSARLAMGSRTSLMIGFFDAIWMQPWWGYGPGQIIQAQIQQAAEGIPVLVSFWSHNIISDMALLFGVPFAAFFVLVAIVFCCQLLKGFHIMGNQFVILAVLPFAIACNVEYPHAYMNSLLLFVFVFGLANLETFVGDFGRGRVASGVVGKSDGWRMYGAAALFFVLGGVIVVDYYRLATALQVARFEAARAGNVPQGYEYPAPLILTNLDAFVYLVRKSDFQDMTVSDVDFYRRAAFRNPYEPALRGYAVLLGLKASSEDDFNSAEVALRILKSIYGVGPVRAAERKIDLLRSGISE